MTDAQLLELKKVVDDNGIVLTSGYGPTKAQNICSSDPEVVKKAIDFFQNLLPKLQLMDIHILGGGLYSYWPLDMSEKMDRAIKNMRILSKTAEECDVVLGMEVLNRYEGYMLNTFHMNIEEDNIPAAIRRAGKDLGHLHLGEQNRQVPGKGSLPWTGSKRY